MVNELHWKTIDYLIKNYDTILIGDFSIKSASKKGESKLSKMTKDIGHLMRFSEFRKRLEYKCGINNIKLKNSR